MKKKIGYIFEISLINISNFVAYCHNYGILKILNFIWQIFLANLSVFYRGSLQVMEQ